jgi:hypothetical protein
MKRFLNFQREEILLSTGSWDHICQAHPDISLDMIDQCLKYPDEVRRSHKNKSSEIYYLLRTQNRFTCVVVKRCPDGNFISSAMTTSKPT